MKFSCSQQVLSRAMNTVSKAVSTRTTLPILKGILIVVREDSVVLSASDLDISISREFDAKVEETGSTVVIARLFGDIVRKLPAGEEIFIEKNEDDSLTVRTISSEFKVITLPADEFPETGKREENDKNFVLDKDIFRSLVMKTSFAASVDESKGVLTGILTEMKEEEMSMVALDGFRLALAREEMRSDEERSFIISAKIMNEIARIVSEDEESSDLDIYLGQKRAVIKTGRTEIFLRIMEGEFIKYMDIIPRDETTKVIVGKSLFMESVERASLMSREGKNNLVKMTVTGNMMTITSRSEEGNVREEIGVDKDGKDIEIGFNSKYIIDVLKEIDDEEIALHMKTSVTPCVVRPTEGKSYEYLILPVRIPTM